MSESDFSFTIYPQGTPVSFQHAVKGLIQGVISRSYFTSSKVISSHPSGLAYIIDVYCPNRGTIQFAKQPSDLSVMIVLDVN